VKKYSVAVIVTDSLGKRGTSGSVQGVEVDARTATEAAQMIARAIEMLSGNL
jgi:hypothetical protein